MLLINSIRAQATLLTYREVLLCKLAEHSCKHWPFSGCAFSLFLQCSAKTVLCRIIIWFQLQNGAKVISSLVKILHVKICLKWKQNNAKESNYHILLLWKSFIYVTLVQSTVSNKPIYIFFLILHSSQVQLCVYKYKPSSHDEALYTVNRKNRTLDFFHNFAKCYTIFIILTMIYSLVNLQ